MTPVTAGSTYNFKVESRSLFGYSTYSEVYPILSATIPDQPQIPTTSVSINNLIVAWSAPYNQGSPILGYHIYIRESDGVSFAEELTHCDGSDLTIRTNTLCSIPLTLILAAPFNKNIGTSIYAKVVAYNIVGQSIASSVGNGAVMFISTVPDAPVNLARDEATTTTTAIGITWSNGAYNGGLPVIDYRLSYD
jgi:hypothetical protein